VVQEAARRGEFQQPQGMLAVSHLQVRGKKPIEINDADVAELVDARDLKSLAIH
jgi:hypothetical protein